MTVNTQQPSKRRRPLATDTPARSAERRAAAATARAMDAIAHASINAATARLRDLLIGHGLPWGPATGIAAGLQPAVTRGLLAGQGTRTQSLTPTTASQRAEHVLSVALQGAAKRPDTAAEALIAAVMLATGADHPAAVGVSAAILGALGRLERESE